MAFKSNMSSYLVLCCVSMLLGLTTAKRKEVTKKLCNDTLTIPSDFNRIPPDSLRNGNINTHSMSPWIWKKTTIENRIPQTIWEAECSSMYCVDPATDSQVVGYKQNSVPIQRLVLVLKTKRTCHIATYINVTVGCTCTWARYY
ncbi:hypothetical protein UPYG_G00230870 [Umbra pygmaea]|uniref:Uncharacterized protein n=1 Tax=Umbra pygmaea TaxID=75934 RepID=A0ABD0WVP0_UMBPY